MFFPERAGLRVVFLARHDIERHICAAAADDLEQIFHLTGKDGKGTGKADIIRALGAVRAQPRALPSREQHGGHFPLPDRPDADFLKLRPPPFDFGQPHTRDGLYPAPPSAQVLGVREHVGKAPIYLSDPREKARLSPLVQVVIKAQQLLLSLFFQQRLCLFVSHFPSPFRGICPLFLLL